MKWLLKQFAGAALGSYSIYHIYSISKVPQGNMPISSLNFLSFSKIEKEQIQSSKEELIRDQVGYHGANSYAYAALEGSRIVGLCYFWHGERYRRERNFWPLSHGEAKLVQIVTVQEMRGRGIASCLIRYASRDMAQRGFHRLYARIWHSNTPSLIAFGEAGWERIATVTELNPLRRKTAFRFVLHRMGCANT